MQRKGVQALRCSAVCIVRRVHEQPTGVPGVLTILFSGVRLPFRKNPVSNCLISSTSSPPRRLAHLCTQALHLYWFWCTKSAGGNREARQG